MMHQWKKITAVILLFALLLQVAGALVSQAEDESEAPDSFNDTMVLENIIVRMQERLQIMEENGINTTLIMQWQEKLAAAQEALEKGDVDTAKQLVLEVIKEIARERIKLKIIMRINLLQKELRNNTKTILIERQRMMKMLQEAKELVNNGNITMAAKLMHQAREALVKEIREDVKLLHQFNMGERAYKWIMEHKGEPRFIAKGLMKHYGLKNSGERECMGEPQFLNETSISG